MNRKQNSLLRKLTKEFLFEDVDVEDAQGDTSSISLDLTVDALILDYGEASETKNDEEESIDLKQFSSKVANLIENYNNILDVPSFVVNDAVNYLQETYDDNIANEFKKILFDIYDIKLDSIDSDSDTPPPLAGAAGPVGAGG